MRRRGGSGAAVGTALSSPPVGQGVRLGIGGLLKAVPTVLPPRHLRQQSSLHALAVLANQADQ